MIDILKKHKTKSIEAKKIIEIDFPVFDEKFKEFIKTENGGYYFVNSFHLFGFSNELPFHSLKAMNNFVKDLYGDLTKNVFFIGEDVFGNLFCYDEKNKFSMFNIESGEFEDIATGFDNFISKLIKDVDYFTGCKFAEELDGKDNELLNFGYRYCAKYPFVLGGEYDVNNLTIKLFKENLQFCASIYHQIKDLPDGAEYEIKIEN
ncbi:MAG: SMI1/KNR4 family protein [Flavobacterium sp.]